MKKLIVSMSIIFFLIMCTLGFAADTVHSTDIKEADGTTGQDTNSGSGIKTGHIQNNAVTDKKIAPGAVTSGKIAAGAITEDKLAPALLNEIFSSKLSVYDSNNVYVGPVISWVTNTRANISMSLSGKPFVFAITAKAIYNIAEDSYYAALYTSSDCTGTMYAIDYYESPAGSGTLYKNLFPSGRVCPNPTTGKVSAYIPKDVAYVMKAIASYKMWDGPTQSFICTPVSPRSDPMKVVPLMFAKDLSSFVPPFHVGY
jgi:hypothetical protein